MLVCVYVRATRMFDGVERTKVGMCGSIYRFRLRIYPLVTFACFFRSQISSKQKKYEEKNEITNKISLYYISFDLDR